MPALKPDHISPTDEETTAIRAGIAADPDARELDDAWFARSRPAKDVLPPALYAALTDKSQPVVIRQVTDAEHAARRSAKKLRGLPHAVAPKQQITVRLSADVLAALRATGRGWQTRMDAILREALAHRQT